MRESIHYALALAHWFEMEARNCDSVEHLWSDFQLILLKLNFVRAHLTLQDGRREWKRKEAQGLAAPLAWSRHKLFVGEAFSLELACESDALDASLFRHFSEIAAESWQKSAGHWCKRHDLPLRFKSLAYQGSPRQGSPRGRAYVPLVWDRSATLQSPSSGPGEFCQIELF
jgi:hypothetical protein